MNERDISPEGFHLAWRCRELYEAIGAYEGSALVQDVLRPWLQAHQADAAEWVGAFGRRAGNPIPPATMEERWGLYAASRISDVLLGSFQEPTFYPQWKPAKITWHDYVFFMTSLGLQVAAPVAFTPFYHEIVAVEQAEDDNELPRLTQTFWPCLMLGDMLFSRAGVGVRAGRNHIRADVGPSSTLYWTFCRRYRPCEDLSHGWGHNSQWRTDFRRDYRLGKQCHFNVDEKHPISYEEKPEPDFTPLTMAERVELVRHRCFVTMTGPHADRHPFRYRLVWTED